MTRRSELDQLAQMLDIALGKPLGDHFIQSAYGQPRLMRDGGSVDVSPRLSSSQLEMWIRAYHAGIIAGKAQRDREALAREVARG